MRALPAVDRIVVHAGSDGKRSPDCLDLYLSVERAAPFEWTGLRNGDCKLFVLGWLEASGRILSGAQWRGKYSTEIEARRFLTESGGSVWLGCELLGPPRMGSSPMRGDVGLMAVDDWHLGMICTGSMWVFRDGKRGLRFSRRLPDITWDLRRS